MNQATSIIMADHYSCDTCQELSTSTGNELLSHIRSVHCHTFHMCGLCNMYFVLENDLNLHITEHIQTQSYPYTQLQPVLAESTERTDSTDSTVVSATEVPYEVSAQDLENALFFCHEDSQHEDQATYITVITDTAPPDPAESLLTSRDLSSTQDLENALFSCPEDPLHEDKATDTAPPDSIESLLTSRDLSSAPCDAAPEVSVNTEVSCHDELTAGDIRSDIRSGDTQRALCDIIKPCYVLLTRLDVTAASDMMNMKKASRDDDVIKTDDTGMHNPALSGNEINQSGLEYEKEEEKSKIKHQTKKKKRKGTRQYIKEKTSRVAYKCSVCSESFFRKGLLTIHRVTSHPDASPYQCCTCALEFQEKDDFKQHLRTHKQHQCVVCDKTFSAKVYLKSHMSVHETGIKPYQCDQCDKSFLVSRSLIAHRRVHTNEKTHACAVCNRRFYAADELTSHMRHHASHKPHQCEICNASFIKKSALNTHLNIHSGNKSFKCPTCEKAFAINATLQRHILTHSTDKRHVCDVCGRGFVQLRFLESHMTIHYGLRFKCTLCDKSYSRRSNLNEHFMTHTIHKPHMCDVCGDAFHVKAALRAHVNSKHASNPLHKCDICGKEFSQKHTLQIHMRTHTQDRQFTCETCGKSFITKGQLKIHYYKHSEEKPYTCDVCGLQLHTEGYLKNHMQIHAKHKPYRCEMCGKGFACRSYLQGHIKRKHGRETTCRSENLATNDFWP